MMKWIRPLYPLKNMFQMLQHISEKRKYIVWMEGFRLQQETADQTVHSDPDRKRDRSMDIYDDMRIIQMIGEKKS